MSDEVLYRERVIPQITSFVPLILLIPAGWLTTAVFAPILGVVIGALIAVTSALLMLGFSPKISIDKKSLCVGRAKIPISKLGEAIVISGKDVFYERGPRLDARAYLKIQSSVNQMMKIKVIDAKDPTPYWLFSTRNPEKIMKVLSSAR